MALGAGSPKSAGAGMQWYRDPGAPEQRREWDPTAGMYRGSITPLPVNPPPYGSTANPTRAPEPGQTGTTTRTGSISGSIRGLQGMMSGGDSTAPTIAAPPREVYHPGNTAPIDTRDSQNAAFGAAKARAGSMGRASMDALRGELADRGLLGGGTEARGLVDRLAAATNPLSDLNVAQLHENVGLASHAQDLENSNANTAYQGGISQRGQDIGVATDNAQMKMQAEKEKQSQTLQALQQALSGLKSIGSSGYSY